MKQTPKTKNEIQTDLDISQFGDFLQIVVSSGRNLSKREGFGGPPSQEHAHPVKKLSKRSARSESQEKMITVN